jgi:hypothetical protein
LRRGRVSADGAGGNAADHPLRPAVFALGLGVAIAAEVLASLFL